MDTPRWESRPDYARWDLLDTFTSRQAALLISDRDPDQNPGGMSLPDSINSLSKQFEGEVVPTRAERVSWRQAQPLHPDLALRLGKINESLAEYHSQHGPEYEGADEVSGLQFLLQRPAPRSPHRRSHGPNLAEEVELKYTRQTIRAWCERRGIRPPAFFPEERTSATGRSGWPWGGYSTELLEELAAAARRFWVNYDPADPTTAPTNADVKNWLVDRGVGERNAEVMATILRADGLRPGPRK